MASRLSTPYSSKMAAIFSRFSVSCRSTSSTSTSAGVRRSSITPGTVMATASVMAALPSSRDSASPVRSERISTLWPFSIVIAAFRFMPQSLFSSRATMRCAAFTAASSSSDGLFADAARDFSAPSSEAIVFTFSYLLLSSPAAFSAFSTRAASSCFTSLGHSARMVAYFLTSSSRRFIIFALSRRAASAPAKALKRLYVASASSTAAHAASYFCIASVTLCSSSLRDKTVFCASSRS